MRSLWFAGLVASLAWVGIASGQHHDAAGEDGPGHHEPTGSENAAAMPLCPVMGDPVDFSIRLQTDDGPVYFCCDSCVGKYKKNPAKYAAKVARQRAALAKRPRIQVTCPVSDKPVDQNVFIENGKQKVYFCCKNCRKKYQADPAKYRAALEGSYTYQTMCPVSDEPIVPGVFTDLPTGQRIYFCCKGCDRKLLKNPEKYAPKLEKQGVYLDVKKLKAAGKQTPASGHGKHDHP